MPGLIALTVWSVAAPVVVLERPPGLKAMRRSRELVAGNGWPVFGVIFVLGVAVAIVSVRDRDRGRIGRHRRRHRRARRARRADRAALGARPRRSSTSNCSAPRREGEPEVPAPEAAAAPGRPVRDASDGEADGESGSLPDGGGLLRAGLLDGVRAVVATAAAAGEPDGRRGRGALAALGARVARCELAPSTNAADDEDLGRAVEDALARSGGADLLVVDGAGLFAAADAGRRCSPGCRPAGISRARWRPQG